MKDPVQENIDGSKEVVHKVEHRINWGYVAVSVAGLVVVWVLYDNLTESNHHKNEDTGL